MCLHGGSTPSNTQGPFRAGVCVHKLGRFPTEFTFDGCPRRSELPQMCHIWWSPPSSKTPISHVHFHLSLIYIVTCFENLSMGHARDRLMVCLPRSIHYFVGLEMSSERHGRENAPVTADIFGCGYYMSMITPPPLRMVL